MPHEASHMRGRPTPGRGPDWFNEVFPIVRVFGPVGSLIVSCLWASLAGGCASVSPQTRLMQAAALETSPGELRATENALAISIPSDIEDSSDDIMNQAEDPAIRGRALQWKMEAVPAYFQTLFQPDPLAAAIDTMAMSAQIEKYLTDGRGRDRFGALQPVAIEAARKIRTDVANAMRLAARRPDAFARLETNIDAWAQSNPIAGASLSSRPSSVPFLIKVAGSENSDVFGVVGSIGNSVADIATRLDIYSGYLPKAARWQSELLADELALRHEVVLVTSTLESMTRLIERAETLTSPESIEYATQFGTSSVRSERVELIAALERMRASVLAYLTSERQAVVSDAASQMRVVLADVDRQRNLTMEEAERLRKNTFIAADTLRRQTLADVNQLGNQIIIKATLAVAALLALTALLGVVVLRTHQSSVARSAADNSAINGGSIEKSL